MVVCKKKIEYYGLVWGGLPIRRPLFSSHKHPEANGGSLKVEPKCSEKHLINESCISSIQKWLALFEIKKEGSSREKGLPSLTSLRFCNKFKWNEFNEQKGVGISLEGGMQN